MMRHEVTMTMDQLKEIKREERQKMEIKIAELEAQNREERKKVEEKIAELETEKKEARQAFMETVLELKDMIDRYIAALEQVRKEKATVGELEKQNQLLFSNACVENECPRDAEFMKIRADLEDRKKKWLAAVHNREIEKKRVDDLEAGIRQLMNNRNVVYSHELAQILNNNPSPAATETPFRILTPGDHGFRYCPYRDWYIELLEMIRPVLPLELPTCFGQYSSKPCDNEDGVNCPREACKVNSLGKKGRDA